MKTYSIVLKTFVWVIVNSVIFEWKFCGLPVPAKHFKNQNKAHKFVNAINLCVPESYLAMLYSKYCKEYSYLSTIYITLLHKASWAWPLPFILLCYILIDISLTSQYLVTCSHLTTASDWSHTFLHHGKFLATSVVTG